jgi:uncharacterized RDD family membrane protein YckC
MKKYTVVINGKPTGPYLMDELAELKIKPSTFVRTEGMDDYKEAHEIEELRGLFGFKYQQTESQYFASFDQRLMASVIDYFLLLLILVAVVLMVYIFIDNKIFRIGTALVGLAILPVAKFVYSVIAESSDKQATIGKRLMDVRVGDIYGNQISLSTSFSRNISKIFSTLPLFMGYLYLFLNKKQQCLHDVIASTYVIKKRLL